MLDIVKSRVNGIDLNALGETVEAIEADPAKALVAFDVTTRWTGQTRSETVVDGYTLGGERIGRSHKIVADEPTELLGGDGAPNPQELLMAAFNACIMLKWNAMGGIHDQFDLTADPEHYLGGNFLLVSYRGSVDAITARFRSSGPVEHIIIPLGGGQSRSYEVRLLYGFKGYG